MTGRTVPRNSTNSGRANIPCDEYDILEAGIGGEIYFEIIDAKDIVYRIIDSQDSTQSLIATLTHSEEQ